MIHGRKNISLYLHLFRLWMAFAKLRRIFLIFFIRFLLCCS